MIDMKIASFKFSRYDVERHFGTNESPTNKIMTFLGDTAIVEFLMENNIRFKIIIDDLGTVNNAYTYNLNISFYNEEDAAAFKLKYAE